MKKIALVLISLALLLALAVPAFAATANPSPVFSGIADDIGVVTENNVEVPITAGTLSVAEETALLQTNLREVMGEDYDPEVEWVIIPLANIKSKTAQTGKLTLTITVKGLTKDSKIGVLHQKSTDKTIEFIKGKFDTNKVTISAESLSPFALVVDPVTAAAVLAQNFNNSYIFSSPNTFDGSYVVVASIAAVVCLAGAAVALKKSKED